MKYGTELYGTYKYAQELTKDQEHTEIYVPDLMQYLPQYYKKSLVMQNVENTIANEIGKLIVSEEELKNQFFVNSATWGLALWEKEMGLQVDYYKPYERRREIIMSKMRGYGTTTKEMIKNVAAAHSGGEVEVYEHNSEYRFEIQFIGVKGIPPNMAGLIQAIDNIKPAHLEYSFKYTYTTWNMVRALTWTEAAKKTWDALRIY